MKPFAGSMKGLKPVTRVLMIIASLSTPFVYADEDPDPLVDLMTMDPSLVIELKYATADNFMEKKLYRSERALLRPQVAERLIAAHSALGDRGLGIKVLDAYRPLSVQREMFEKFPYPGFVADPARGSNHNRGAAVDVTLVDREGKELAMPSAYDEFSERSHIRYAGAMAEETENRRILQDAMVGAGFEPLETEWWHFNDPGAGNYAVLDVAFEDIR